MQPWQSFPTHSCGDKELISPLLYADTFSRSHGASIPCKFMQTLINWSREMVTNESLLLQKRCFKEIIVFISVKLLHATATLNTSSLHEICTLLRIEFISSKISGSPKKHLFLSNSCMLRPHQTHPGCMKFVTFCE